MISLIASAFNRRHAIRRLLLASLVACSASLALSGCGGHPMRLWSWHARPIVPPLPPKYISLSPDAFYAKCAGSTVSRAEVWGCSERDYAKDECRVYYTGELTPFIKGHEDKHCLGYEHD